MEDKSMREDKDSPSYLYIYIYIMVREHVGSSYYLFPRTTVCLVQFFINMPKTVRFVQFLFRL